MNRFTISDIEHLTGIKSHTIRKWEERYQLINGNRTASNIRYYDDSHLRFLLNVNVLLKEGFRISHIAKMSNEAVAHAVKDLYQQQPGYLLPTHELLDATIRLDDNTINRILSQCIAQKGFTAAMKEVIFPFMNKVGTMWQVGTINTAHEHFVTNIIRQKIVCAIDALPPGAQPAKKFLLFLPPGELHDTGLLMGSYLLKQHGCHVLYLGADVPFADLAGVVTYYQPAALVTVITTAVHETPGVIVENMLTAAPGMKLILAGQHAGHESITTHDSLYRVYNYDEFEQLIRNF